MALQGAYESAAILEDDERRLEPKHCTTDQVVTVRRVLQDTRETLGSHHDLTHYASVAGYSPYHFHRLFAEVTGTTPGRFLAALRMQEAKAQLAETDRSVTSVCFDVGYGSLGTFTSQFKRLVGVSPGKFRKLVDSAAGRTIGDTSAENSQQDGDGTPVELLSMSSSYVAVVGLFRSDIPQGTPASFMTLHGEYRGMLDLHYIGESNQLFVVAYPSDTSLACVALGQTTGVLVGHQSFRLSSANPPTPESPPDVVPIRVSMGQPSATQPPIVSCAAALQMLAHG